jgi:hypothetical protein
MGQRPSKLVQLFFSEALNTSVPMDFRLGLNIGGRKSEFIDIRNTKTFGIIGKNTPFEIVLERGQIHHTRRAICKVEAYLFSGIVCKKELVMFYAQYGSATAVDFLF